MRKAGGEGAPLLREPVNIAQGDYFYDLCGHSERLRSTEEDSISLGKTQRRTDARRRNEFCQHLIFEGSPCRRSILLMLKL